jgi:hypothetical protein
VAVVAHPCFGARHHGLQPRGAAHQLDNVGLVEMAQPSQSKQPEDYRKDHQQHADTAKHPRSESILCVSALELLESERSPCGGRVSTSPGALYGIAGVEASAYETEEKQMPSRTRLHCVCCAQHELGTAGGRIACLQARPS